MGPHKRWRKIFNVDRTLWKDRIEYITTDGSCEEKEESSGWNNATGVYERVEAKDDRCWGRVGREIIRENYGNTEIQSDID